MSESASENRFSRACRRKSHAIHAAAASAIAMKSSRCQPPASERKLKAAPRLWTRTRLKNGVTVRLSCRVKVRCTRSLVRWSRTTITPARPSHLGMRAGLSGTGEIGDAAAADLGVGRIRAHVRAVMPAALALAMRAGRDTQLHTGENRVDGVRRRIVREPRLRGDEDELE